MAPRVGELVKGRYRLLRLLGDGGMGSVFEARHEILGTTVALKFLHPHLARRRGVKERFLREAQLSARIQSPHVVSARDVDETDGGDAFMVMEYIEGGTLLDHYEALRREGRWLSRARAFELMLQLFDGVEAAHALGIVHRDLKPDNVMLASDELGGTLLKILDFGVAKLKATGEVTRGLTLAGTAMGTPEYMAPEQALSADKADHRADVFALGVMFYEMLSARRPVEVHAAMAIAHAYLSGEVAPLREVDPALAAVIHRALAARPDDRYPSVAAFREAILPFVPEGRERAVAPTVPMAYAPTVPGAPLVAEIHDEETVRPLEAAPQPQRHGRLWPMAVALAAVAAIAGGALAYPALRVRLEAFAESGAFDMALAPPGAAPVEQTELGEAIVTGTSNGWRVRIEHSRRRDDASLLDLAIALERREGDGWKAALLRRVAASFAYYLEHTSFGHTSAVADPVYRYPFSIALPRDGKYHLDLELGSVTGSPAFSCDICVGADPAHCPAMRPSCEPRKLPPRPKAQPKPPALPTASPSAPPSATEAPRDQRPRIRFRIPVIPHPPADEPRPPR